MTALQQLDALLADPRRQAALPRGMQRSGSAADRALRRRCADGTLMRTLPRPAATNLDFNSGGNVWRVDRPCRRLLVKRTVWRNS